MSLPTDFLRHRLDALIVEACARPHDDAPRHLLISELEACGFVELAQALKTNGYELIRETWIAADNLGVVPNFDVLYRSHVYALNMGKDVALPPVPDVKEDGKKEYGIGVSRKSYETSARKMLEEAALRSIKAPSFPYQSYPVRYFELDMETGLPAINSFR